LGYAQKDYNLETWKNGKSVTLTKSHPNSLADLITALNKLSPSDEEAVHAIFEMLGIRLETEISKVEHGKPHEETPKSFARKDEEPVQTEPAQPSTPPENSTKPDEPSVPSALIHLGKSQVDLPTWFHNPLPLKSTTGSGGSTTHYPLQTLFVSNWTRALLVSALSTYSNFGPIDVEEIIRLISLYEPVREVPRRPWPTMVQGVQVLIDKSKALEPFYKDQANLKSAVRKVAGSDRTQTMEFVGCPSWGVRSAKSDDWSDYCPPPSGTTVLVITDLGILQNPYITDQAEVRDWLRFAAIIQEAGCSLVAFVPYPSSRWPKLLQNTMKIVQWDRTTSTSTIQQIVKKRCKC
jgi:hypothetical protein